MKDINCNSNFKVDIRILNDQTIQRYNDEADVGVAEVKHDPGVEKYSSDRCKLFSEGKVIIDNFLIDSCSIDSTYSIQFCGMEMMILSTTLAANGLYVGDEIHHCLIDNNLNNFQHYFDTIKQLLCFRDEAVRISNERDEKLSSSKRTSVKDYGQQQHRTHTTFEKAR